jgi:DNA-binding NtrC family response regulator
VLFVRIKSLCRVIFAVCVARVYCDGENNTMGGILLVYKIYVMNIFKNQKTVLLVEDDAVLRSALKDEFVSSNWKVLETGEADAIHEILAEGKPDAVVLDLILPAQDGVSLLEEMRSQGHTFPVVILSNLAGSDNLRADADRLDASFFNKSSVMLGDVVKAVEQKVQ